MVYLLKWLISLITPHTHDKEGKQGNSFIVRKALGNRASFSSLASKKGSSLLLVVMTMSVIIVISSSFMLLSFNTGIGSIFASSQQKAQLSCLSVAEGLKNGTNFGNIYSFYNNQPDGWAAGTSKSFVANNTGLYGTTKVTMTKVDATKIEILVKTEVGKSNYQLKFTHSLKTGSFRDVINQISNSMSVSGGGSFSMQTGTVDGDLSLDGNYLLAMLGYKEVNEITNFGKIGYTVYPGTINGNVYCNGSLIVGYKGEDIKVYLKENQKEKAFSNVVPTIIKKNVYVNGDLIINACEIEGDVYVSGNVLFNGLVDGVRGGTDGKSCSTDNENAIIKGNLYVGGSIYVPTGSFERYYPEKEMITNSYYVEEYDKKDDFGIENDYDEFHNGAYTFKTFPEFPDESEIKAASASGYENVLAGLYSKTINLNKDFEENNSAGNKYFFNDGSDRVLYKDFLKDYNTPGEFLSDVLGEADDVSIFINDDSTCIGVQGKNCHRYIQEWYSSKYEYNSKHQKRASNLLFALLTGRYYNDDDYEDASHISPTDNTLQNTIVKEYEKKVGKVADTNEQKFLDIVSKGDKTLVVNGSVYVQNNAYVQLSDKKLGNSPTSQVVICGNLTTFGVNTTANAEGVASAYKAFTVVGNGNNGSLIVSGTKTEYVFERTQLVAKDTHYFEAYMSICGGKGSGVQDGHSSPKYDSKEVLYKKGKWYKFYQGKNCDDFYLDKATDTSFRSLDLGGTKAVEGWTKVHGIRAFGVYAMGCKIVKTENTSVNSRLSVINDQAYTGEMYSEKFIENHNNVARSEQARTRFPATVADVFKEMGVYNYSATEISDGDYQKPYNNPDNDDYSYPNLKKTRYDAKEYRPGDNKLNDRNGVNFTGVTSATQISFGYSLQKAISAKAVRVTKRGNAAGTTKKPGSAAAITDVKNEDTFFGRLWYIGGVSGEDDFKEKLKENKEKLLSNGYAGLYGRVNSELRVYIITDIVMYDMKYVKNTQIGAQFNVRNVDKNQDKLRLYFDTSLGNINVYINDMVGWINIGDNGWLGTSMLLADGQKNQFNVAYIYALPNIAYANRVSELKSGNGNNVLSLGSLETKVEGDRRHIDQIVAAKVVDEDDRGQKIYQYTAENGAKYFYKYATFDYKSGTDLNDTVLTGYYFSVRFMMWENSRITNYYDDVNNNISLPMFMCEGPMLFSMAKKGGYTNCVIYMPNPKSVFFCADEETKGTYNPNASDKMLKGGAIVSGKVIGTNNNNGQWQYFGKDLDIASKLSEALGKTNGLGDITVDNGTNSTANWSAGGYE